jgi:hypothetical protein
VVRTVPSWILPEALIFSAADWAPLSREQQIPALRERPATHFFPMTEPELQIHALFVYPVFLDPSRTPR